MDAQQIRNLSPEEIEARLDEEADQLEQLRFQHAVAPLQNPIILREKRRLIARLKTIRRERELANEPA